ncbi:MAG: glycine--tRNA ligase [Omnitrophica WOR_2 bacterium GWF2_38_59]|nr:MAG: glycine--tRNA ligase [Omnitrophica WOR_2 bacterium GWF2_38_59]OGX51087.1 MAG: glycine--tRNA ligase [Omnitrophica WOR_2 bacterium RIFOXYA2_FULL_38_17]OGX56153.1 MAG: glycine--tRNA ligase [Omnitrophica WOR_2 bacterium RIFOXYC2_FULL_38_12]OGX60411.1 MAG: glycine--tRNA ligase [Omnitrophica WOR_2 bacterium RIFOXYB2_FULL_38_16]HBG60917.1 glycine--tRNA ligase [Candidatus Omnitrophota bacterium]
MKDNELMDKIVSLCKRRGFIFQSSEIYGGLGSTWDYGPLGAELKRNVKNAWWKSVVHDREDIVGLDASILMHPKTWEASGHVEGFNDILVDCKKCKGRFRQDHLKGKCPNCGANDFTEGRAFNLMMSTNLGAMEDSSSKVFFRPETAQGIFVNFQNVIDSTSRKLPFGIAQMGKSFRNEVTAGNFTFRMREFEQMEVEYFTTPQEAEKCHEQWIAERFQWYVDLGIKKENLQLREHGSDELAHYAKRCCDVEYNFPFGWSELEGIANRADFDLKQHSEFSGKDLRYQDKISNERFFPYVIEPSGGVDRATLAFLVDAYHEEEVEGSTRVVLRLNKKLAPRHIAILPLLKKNNEIVNMAKNIKSDLQKDFVCVYDDTAAIGKLYRRQDEVGTAYCLTIDVQSLEDKQVTIRDRDTMKQERISVENLKKYFKENLGM